MKKKLPRISSLSILDFENFQHVNILLIFVKSKKSIGITSKLQLRQASKLRTKTLHIDHIEKYFNVPSS